MTRLILIILDGWGITDNKEGNAILLAKKPNFDHLISTYPSTILEASGEAVGLPKGIMGNSEVGHLNIGAGRTIYQDLTHISHEIETGAFFKNKVLLDVMRKAKENNSKLHLMGLVSNGGVHSSMDHIFALLTMAKKMGLEKVYLHAYLDGRDTPPQSAEIYLKELEDKMNAISCGQISSIGGRYYGMDRDKRWERIHKAYVLFVQGEGRKIVGWSNALKEAYSRGETDEFVIPTITLESPALIQDNDSVLFFNFRPDRGREMTRALVYPDFKEFERPSFPKISMVTMAEYDASLNDCVQVAYPPEEISETLGEVISRNHLSQLRIAETEKYAHVTYFFNGGKEKPNPAEDRILVPSPKVATYDLQPEMSIYELTDTLLKQIGRYDFIVLNFANPDMLGHTGILPAVIKAIEVVDENLGKVVNAVLKQGGVALITSDHGNAEEMIAPKTGKPQTAHTTNPVPFILVDPQEKNCRLRERGILADIAPTILDILNLPKPEAMTGESLVCHSAQTSARR